MEVILTFAKAIGVSTGLNGTTLRKNVSLRRGRWKIFGRGSNLLEYLEGLLRRRLFKSNFAPRNDSIFIDTTLLSTYIYKKSVKVVPLSAVPATIKY